MQSFNSIVRVHAGLYVSGDGRFKIRRVKALYTRGWRWQVYVLDEGYFVEDMRFRTLKVAREYVAERSDSFGIRFS